MDFEEYKAELGRLLEEGEKKGESPFDRTTPAGKLMVQAAQEDRLDVAMERLCRCARDAYKVDVWVEDVPDPEYLRSQRQETRQQMRELEAEAIRAEVSRMRVPNVLPLSGAEMERRIQSAQSARQMPERGRRR